MSKDINTLGNNGDLNPKTPKNLGEDFEAWLKGREYQKNFLEKKNNLNTRSELADLKESLGMKPHEKKLGPSFEVPKNSFPQREESAAFTDTIETRQVGDEGKNVLHGIKESISVSLEVLVYGIVDGVKVLFNLPGEFGRTAAILKEESSAKII